MLSTPEDLLTVEEVATLLSVSEQTIRAWAREGKLPILRLGERTLRVRRADLDAFVNQSGSEPR